MLALTLFSGCATAQTQGIKDVRNTVLVHGAWADGSGWQGVQDVHTARGYKVSIVKSPLTSLADDVVAVDRVLERQDGRVLLVGHFYGGIVISEAGDAPNVAGLVYVAAFAPDAGESVVKPIEGRGQPPVQPSADGFVFFTSPGAGQSANRHELRKSQ